MHSYLYLTPKPSPYLRSLIREAYRMLDTLEGYTGLPLLCRHDFRWLLKWAAKHHPFRRDVRTILDKVA